MLLNLDNIIEQYKLNIFGVIHIGAHFGEEYDMYVKNNITNIIFFEPVPDTYKILEYKLTGKAKLVNTALGNTIGDITMYIETANKGQSSSILAPALHLQQYPHIKFENELKVPITTLDRYMLLNDDIGKYNMINIDVQGYELEVFKGSKKSLEHIDYIITEVNRDNVYHKCVLVNELDEYLNNYGFKRVETTWDGGTWGDALYVKR